MVGDDRTGPNGSREKSAWAAAGEYTGYGLTWALSVLLFLLGGWWVDGVLGTTPLLMIVGAFVGATAGFYSMYQHLVVIPRDRREGRDDRDEEPG